MQNIEQVSWQGMYSLTESNEELHVAKTIEHNNQVQATAVKIDDSVVDAAASLESRILLLILQWRETNSGMSRRDNYGPSDTKEALDRVGLSDMTWRIDEDKFVRRNG